LLTLTCFSDRQSQYNFNYFIAQVTELIQGDQYATIGCVVPSLVALHKLLASLQKSAKYLSSLIRQLLDSLGSRFSGLYENISMPFKANKARPFGEKVYLLAAVLDPNYGYIWLDVDHPGTDLTKASLKQTITG
jgi:hypothetical protein